MTPFLFRNLDGNPTCNQELLLSGKLSALVESGCKLDSNNVNDFTIGTM